MSFTKCNASKVSRGSRPWLLLGALGGRIPRVNAMHPDHPMCQSNSSYHWDQPASPSSLSLEGRVCFHNLETVIEHWEQLEEGILEFEQPVPQATIADVTAQEIHLRTLSLKHKFQELRGVAKLLSSVRSIDHLALLVPLGSVDEYGFKQVMLLSLERNHALKDIVWHFCCRPRRGYRMSYSRKKTPSKESPNPRHPKEFLQEFVQAMNHHTTCYHGYSITSNWRRHDGINSFCVTTSSEILFEIECNGFDPGECVG